MNRKIVVAMAALLLTLPSGGTAQTVSRQKEALDAIAEFADKICDRIPLEGGVQNLEASGAAKAEIGKLIDKLASLNISGAAKYKTEQYQNVLRQDLAASLKDSRTCKQKVFLDLRGDLMPKPGAALDGQGRNELAQAAAFCQYGQLSRGKAVLQSLQVRFPKNEEVEAQIEGCSNDAGQTADVSIALQHFPAVFLSGKGDQPNFARLALYVDGDRCGSLSNRQTADSLNCGELSLGEHSFELRSVAVNSASGESIMSGGNCGGYFGVGRNTDKYGIVMCLKKPYINCQIMPMTQLVSFDSRQCRWRPAAN